MVVLGAFCKFPAHLLVRPSPCPLPMLHVTSEDFSSWELIILTPFSWVPMLSAVIPVDVSALLGTVSC